MSQDGIERGDHPNGVVFYLLSEDQVTRAWCEKAARHIAEQFVNGFVVRFGMRDGEEPKTFWIGFNSRQYGGNQIEYYLLNLAKKRLARYTELHPGHEYTEQDFLAVLRRKYQLPGPVPNPPLRPVLTHLVPDEAPPPPAAPPTDNRPAAPTGRGGLMDQARIARERLRGEGVNLSSVVSGLASRVPDEYRGRLPRLGRRRKQRGTDEGS
jgi:hypothetical protein